MASPGSRVGRNSALLWAAAAIAAGTLLMGGSQLLADLYVMYSRELSRSGLGKHAAVAARRAQAVAPWRIETYRAQLDSGWRSHDSSIPVAATALRWSPSDPYLWAELGRVLVMEDKFGSDLAGVLRTTETLAPNSPQLHRINVWIGLRYWHRGNPEVRGHWLNSMRFFLKTQPRLFGRTLKRHGQVERFCWTAGPELNLEAWCDRQLPD